MANRFTAPEKWSDPWFCGLSIKDKLFWIYICDNCDHAGIWKVNWPLVKFHIPDYQFNKEEFEGRIEILNEQNWFLKKFILFQQKIDSLEELNPLNRCHLSIINILKTKGLISPKQASKKGLDRGYSIGNSKGKGNKGVVKGKSLYLDFVLLTQEEHDKLVTQFGEQGANERIARLNEYGHTKPKKFKEYGSHYHTILTWARKETPDSEINLTKQQRSNLRQLVDLRKDIPND